MKTTQFICLLFCVANAVAAAQGISLNISNIESGIAFRYKWVMIFYLCVKAVVFALASYGIFRRNILAWKFGWLGFAFMFLDFAIAVLSFSLKLEYPNSLYCSGSILLSTTCGAFFFGVWWFKQKSFFSAEK